MMMYTYLWILLSIAFLIFFRTDVVKILKKFEDHPYRLSLVVLLGINYILLLNLDAMHNFILIFAHFFLNLVQGMLKLLGFFGLNDESYLAREITKSMILAFLMFYPLHYQRKHKSFAYKSERVSVQVIYFILTVFFYFFCLRYKI